MATVLTILIIIVCVLLILVILVQNSKGGGLSATFAGSNQVMGVRKTTDFLEKATWTLAIVLCSFSLIYAAMGSGTEAELQQSEIKEFVNNSPVAPPPNLPTDAPKPPGMTPKGGGGSGTPPGGNQK